MDNQGPGRGKNRLDKWKEPIRMDFPYIGPFREDDPVRELIHQRRANNATGDGRKVKWSPLSAAKELIFDIDNGKPSYHVITSGFDLETCEWITCHLVDLIPESDDDAKSILLEANAFEIPVYPNNDTVVSQLAIYQEDVLRNGAKITMKDGEKRFRTTRLSEDFLSQTNLLENLDPTVFLSPSELLVVRRYVLQDIEARDEAGQILERLRSGISELTICLAATKRNESDLQACLTKYPILFGINYKSIIPQHKLGSEFVMDYALEKVSGDVDLVEIEASSHRLFTNAGDPSKALIHAERQVSDWLTWIEEHHTYSREHLTNLWSPIGLVIIGRDTTDEDRVRIRQRNRLFKGNVQILTYDDLLRQANEFLARLTGV